MMSTSLRTFTAGLCLTVAFGLTGCTTTTIPMTGIEVPMIKIPIPMPKIPLLSRGEGDLRYKRWDDAFEETYNRLVKEYPFTEWKGVDWPALYEKYAPQVDAARAERDKEAFYLAFRSFLYDVPDGNLRIAEDTTYRRNAIGGGFGFSVIQLDNGLVIAHIVDDQGPAAKAGLAWGAEIVEWNKQPVQEALAATSTMWASSPPATNEGQRLERCRFLTRAPIGTEVSFKYRNPEDIELTDITLTAIDDGYTLLDRSQLNAEPVEAFTSPIQSKTLPSGHGYIKVFFLAPTMATPFPARAFEKTIENFIDAGVPGIVLDLRGNTGGDDSLVPKFAGHFAVEPAFYQDVALLNPETDAFEVLPEMQLRIMPARAVYRGPVVVLIDHNTFAAGEGLALAMQRLEQVKVVGIQATHGSLGITGGDITLPQNYALSYPVGRSLDEAGAIQVTSNAEGDGGVIPDIRIPLDPGTVYALYAEGTDLPLEQAIELLKQATPAG